jgi:glycosyltransferase involved in cell wall biosynthesis
MQAKKTVLIYRNELLPLSETFIKEQIMALQDWRAVLVGRRLLNQLPLENLDVRIVGPERLTFHNRLLWKARRMLGVVPTHVKRALQGERASLVHAHFGPDALDAWPLARALKLPLLVTLHGYDINTYREWWQAGNAGTRMRSYPRRLLRLARQPHVGFIAVSEAIRRRAIEFGIPAEKIAVSYIGIDTSKFTPGAIPIEKRLPRVLFVGRLVEKKGCRYLIEAMSTVQRNVPGARVIVVGDGPLRQDLELLARGLGVDAEFRGAQSSADVKRELDDARVFCLPSVTAENGDAEGFGLVLLEAQASGVPVVTSARGGATEGIRDGATGFSFAEGNVSMLAERLTDLLTEDNILVQMAEQSSQYVSKEFNLTNCARRLEVLYDDFCLSAPTPKDKT